MYAQVTTIHVPIGAMPQMRQIIEHDYLSTIRARPGFVNAQLLEQIDDPETALLLVHWDTHEAVENFNRTGLLESSVQALAAGLPGVRVQRQGYIIHVEVEGATAARA
ncbi:MAG: antibiotic biosynthesis monooxygenase [Chloroflexota bacterium]|nr:antibiotic biosynthesis monooxygenase [Chloroflexota bacterium]